MTRPNTESDFWARVSKSPDHWMWLGGLSRGHGQFRMKGTLHRVHRLSYQWVVGPIPKDKEIDRLCRVKLCVDPSHLEPVVHRVNVLRGEAPAAYKARQSFCKNGHPLTEDNLVKGRLKKGHRNCRICINAASRRYYAIHRNWVP